MDCNYSCLAFNKMMASNTAMINITSVAILLMNPLVNSVLGTNNMNSEAKAIGMGVNEPVLIITATDIKPAMIKKNCSNVKPK